jgi:hypothetical protein
LGNSKAASEIPEALCCAPKRLWSTAKGCWTFRSGFLAPGETFQNEERTLEYDKELSEISERLWRTGKGTAVLQ